MWAKFGNPDAQGRRPIPTPARALNGGAKVASPLLHECEIETLTTLLEEAILSPESENFYLSSTLVEALYEHFDGCPAEPTAIHSPTGAPEAWTLRLDQHLGVRTFDLTGVTMRVGCTLDHVAQLIHRDPDDLWPLPSKESDVITEWARRCPPLPDALGVRHCDSIVIYTDGSYDGKLSSWAFHAIGSVAGEWHNIGWIGDRVQTDSGEPTFLGASSHGALEGELSALFWCLIWLLASPPEVEVTIFSDCTTAIGLSEGSVGQFRGKDAAHLCRAAMHALQAAKSPSRINVRHIRAHVGHLGNEVADRLAKKCCDPRTTGKVWASHPICSFVRRGWLPWLWLFLDSQRSPQNWPGQLADSFIDRGDGGGVLPTRSECEQMLGLQAPPEKDSGKQWAVIQIVLVTVNVQSLHPREAEPTAEPPAVPFQGRAALLREQFVELGVGVAALQETRASRNETIQSKTHIRFCSACDAQGSYGVELWFSRTEPFIKHNKTDVLFQLGDFVAVHWDPRILAVRFARASVRVLFVAIHAPTNASPERNKWWQDLRVLLGRLRQDAQLVLLGDFNLHLHRSCADRVGDLTWPAPTPPPQAFWNILEDALQWIPSTFSCCHPGPTETWQSPGGTTTSRLDYISLPETWHVAADGSRVLHELEWGQARVDHYALITRAVSHILFHAPKHGRRVRIDTTAIGTPEGREKLRQICSSLPQQPWQLDIHRHAAKVEQHFRCLLPVAFPAQRAIQHKPYLQPATWQLRNQRAWLRKRIQSASRFGRSFSLACSWRAWRGTGTIWAPYSRFWSRWLQCLRDLPGHLAALRSTSVQLRCLIRQDTKDYLHEVAVKATTDSTRDTVQRLRVLTGGPKRKQKGATPLPAIETEQGTLATTHQEAKQKWISHFSSIEDGQVKDPVEFVHDCYRRQQAKDLSDYTVTPADIPSLGELEAALRASSTDRAFGLDGIPGEVLHYGASHLAKAVYQLGQNNVVAPTGAYWFLQCWGNPCTRRFVTVAQHHLPTALFLCK
ncbi:unnamed protein product [Symbiodinium sp. CCMP2456]|nr:unnamed protein product [Symbiodinium sp. CCMP2456]